MHEFVRCNGTLIDVYLVQQSVFLSYNVKKYLHKLVIVFLKYFDFKKHYSQL